MFMYHIGRDHTKIIGLEKLPLLLLYILLGSFVFKNDCWRRWSVQLCKDKFFYTNISFKKTLDDVSVLKADEGWGSQNSSIQSTIYELEVNIFQLFQRCQVFPEICLKIFIDN